MEKATGAASILAFMAALVLADVPAFMSFYLRASTWIFWAVMALLLAGCWRKLELGRLVRPLAPYFIWLAFYLTWGLIISAQRDYAFAVRLVATTALLGATMAALLANSANLRRFATMLQLAAFANLLLLLLALRYPQLNDWIQLITHRPVSLEVGFDRYGGLWNNPNILAYICLLAAIFSCHAAPWSAWLGRLTCLPIMYYSASRKSTLLFLVVLLLYVIMVQRRNIRFWYGALIAMVVLAMAFTASANLQRESRSASRDANLVRLLDVEEENTVARGGESRVGLLKDWLSTLSAEPWYGYGLNAMFGDQYSEKDPNRMVQKGLVWNGTHNTYLGMWIDAGPVGFLAFMLMILPYAKSSFTYRGQPTARWVVVSLALVNLCFLFVSHSMLSSLEGQVTYTLMFLLPTCPALRGPIRSARAY
jgi:O-antigen ligase